MRRRDFITLVSGAAAWPLTASAQQPPMPSIGLLSANLSDEAASPFVIPLLQGINQVGFVEGRNFRLEQFHEGRQPHRLREIAAELARRPVSLIMAIGTVAALAAKVETTVVPIVFATGDDPVSAGIVASIARPTGNVTGVSFANIGLSAKRLQLLRGLVPQASPIGLLAEADNSESQNQSEGQQQVARSLGIELVVRNVVASDDFENVFAALAQQRVGALSVAGGPLMTSRRDQLVALAERFAIPTMYSFRAFAAAGGLISYGASFAASMVQAGLYAGRIIRGDKPADLPVVQPTKFELVINLKSAKALGLEIPPMLLALADEVIE